MQSFLSSKLEVYTDGKNVLCRFSGSFTVGTGQSTVLATIDSKYVPRVTLLSFSHSGANYHKIALATDGKITFYKQSTSDTSTTFSIYSSILLPLSHPLY